MLGGSFGRWRAAGVMADYDDDDDDCAAAGLYGCVISEGGRWGGNALAGGLCECRQIDSLLVRKRSRVYLK